MSKAKKQAKKARKDKARREKARRVRARQLEAQASDEEGQDRAPALEREASRSARRPTASKPLGRPSSQGHRTQGK